MKVKKTIAFGSNPPTPFDKGASKNEAQERSSNNEKTTNSAFTLIETLIVITILSTSLLIGSSLVITSLKASEKNKNRFIATYLTQECLELARNARDTAWKQNLPWDCSIPNVGDRASIENESYTSSVVSCLTPTNTMTSGIKNFVQVSNNPDDFIIWQKDGLFTHNNTIPDIEKTIFSRRLETHQKLSDKAKISCETSWTQDGQNEHIKIFEILTNWK